MSFIERHGLWTDAQAAAARDMERAIVEHGIEQVRFAFADQHGVLRGKAIVAADAMRAMHAGVRLVSTLLLKDTSNRTVWPVFTRGGGFGTPDWEGANDVVLVADPTTFTPLPWAAKTGWVLCEARFPDGRPVPFDTRGVLRRALERLGHAGFDFAAGLEVEFHAFRVTDPRLSLGDSGWPGSPPQVELLHGGYQLLSEQRYDQAEAAIEPLRRAVLEMGMPLRSVEIELGPSQFEFVFHVANGMRAADTMVMFRNAAKQILRRHGMHATFMCRPAIPNVMSSGWHLHQSLVSRADGGNAFVVEAPRGERTDAAHWLSPTGVHFLGGLVEHADACAVFATPTINGYRRYHRVAALAPVNVTWGADNRGTMLRVIGEAGDPATRIENRIGEPAANPYLYMASQVHAGLDGLARRLDPGPAAQTPYDGAARKLPTTLENALAALRASATMREALGGEFVDYYARIKEFELARFNAEVTEWEQREYFDLY